MESFLDALTESFRGQSQDWRQLSVSRDNLENGNWELELPVPVDEIINSFRIQDELVQENGPVIIPLHEEDSPNLTGEFLHYHRQTDEELLRENTDPDELHFLNASSQSGDILPVGDSSESYLAFRMRFWHSSYSLPGTPDFLPGEYFDDRPPNPPRTVTARSPYTGQEYEEFSESIRDWLDQEFEAEKQSIWETTQYHPIRRIKREHGSNGITGTTASFTPGSSLMQVSAPVPGIDESVESTYGIFEGNLVVVAAGDETEQPEGLGIVSRVSPQSFNIEFDWSVCTDSSVARENLANTDIVSIALVDRNIARQREREAFASMVDSREGRRILSGDDPLSFESPLTATLDTSLELNRFQRRAAINALRTNHAYLIHGPPGTGKTRTLTAVIESAVNSGQRVLVCAHSNQAVDNLIAGESTVDSVDEESLHGIVQENEFNLIRIGELDRITSDVVTSNYRNQTFDEAHIVATTTNSSGQLDGAEFDMVVVDEATQASIPATAVPFPLGECIILAGDHKQLHPFSASEPESDDELVKSLFEHLIEIFGETIMTTLRKQYRMNEIIAEFSNTEFYSDLLLHGDSNRNATIDELNPLVGIHIGENEVSRGYSWANPREAEIVSAQIQTLRNQDVRPQDIGVITPYLGQRQEVIDELQSEFGQGVADRIKVQTIDAFQGGQREAIIVSFTRSNSEGRSGFLEFPVEGPRRLNVALTRAKKRLVLIGNWDTLRTRNPHREDDESCADVYDRLADYVRGNGNMFGY